MAATVTPPLLAEPERVNGRRRYGSEMLDLLAAIRVAQRAGFTIAETRTLIDGFSPEEPPPERGRVLAREKLAEVEALIDRARAMKRLLERGLHCECLSIEDCALLEEERRSAVRELAKNSGLCRFLGERGPKRTETPG